MPLRHTSPRIESVLTPDGDGLLVSCISIRFVKVCPYQWKASKSKEFPSLHGTVTMKMLPTAPTTNYACIAVELERRTCFGTVTRTLPVLISTGTCRRKIPTVKVGDIEKPLPPFQLYLLCTSMSPPVFRSPPKRKSRHVQTASVSDPHPAQTSLPQ